MTKRVRIVAGDIRRKQVKSKAFWFMVLMPFIFVAITFAMGYFAAKSVDGDDEGIGLVASQEMGKYFKSNDDFTFVKGSKEELAKKFEKDPDKVYLEVEEKNGQVHLAYHGDASDVKTLTYIRLVAENIQKDLNVREAQISKSQRQIMERQPVVDVKNSDKAESKAMTTAFSVFSIVFMMLIITSYANTVVTDIAQEKGSKMIEFILSSVRAGEYFLGKVRGNFLVVFTHIGIYAIGGVVALGLNHKYKFLDFEEMGIKVSFDVGMVGLQLVIYLILGFFIYLLLAAGLASLTTKLEDASKMIAPVTLLLMVSYFISIMHVGIGAKESLIFNILSNLPFLSTFLMPSRLLMGEATALQGRIGIGILGVSIVVVYMISAKTYKNNILNYTTDKLFGRNKKRTAKVKKSK